MDVGLCPSGSYKRFYFDEERQTCMAFVYTGCGGNRNRFKTFESCMQMCYKSEHLVFNPLHASKGHVIIYFIA